MKRVVLAIKNGLISEAVTLALKKAGFAVEKAVTQSASQILLACEAVYAELLVMDVTRTGDGTFDLRMQTVKSVKAQNPDIKVALLCDKVSDAVRQGVRRNHCRQGKGSKGRGGDRRFLL